MREHWYRPGGDGAWVTVATQNELLVVEAAAAIGVEQIWSTLPTGFQAMLDVLTSRGFSATPSFVLLSWSASGELRAIVRGPARLTVSTDDDDRMLDGTGVSTWAEQIFPAGSRFELALGGAPTGPALPLVSGAVAVVHIASAPGAQAAAVGSDARSVSTAQPASTAESASSTAPASAAEPERVDDVLEATVVSVRQRRETVSEATMTGSDVDSYDELVSAPAPVAPASIAAAPIEPATAESASAESTPPTIPPAAGDHDGMTIMTGDLRRMRAERKAGEATSVAAPVDEHRVPAMRLELWNGTVEPLDQTLIVGRSPSASKVSGGAIPRLITIPGDKDISRNHAQFALEGGTAVVTDLHSRNGTQIIMPGRAPQQLRQGEPTAVIVGTVVDLGGGVTLTVREAD